MEESLEYDLEGVMGNPLQVIGVGKQVRVHKHRQTEIS